MDIGRAKKLTRPRATKKRVGRGTGSRRGKLSGRGRDGAASRAGWSERGISGNMPLWRRLPKVGFSNEPFKTEYLAVNVSRLNAFPDGAVVTPEELRKAGMAKQAPEGRREDTGPGRAEQGPDREGERLQRQRRQQDRGGRRQGRGAAGAQAPRAAQDGQR